MSSLDDFVEECLLEHNAKRALHGAPPLKHSRVLDKTAQDWAEELISQDSIKNSPLSSCGDIGESISLRTSTATHVNIQGVEVVDQWYTDMKNYDFQTGKGAAGNFTQLVWNATREVGFGKTRAPGKCIVVAHYQPPGNVRGHYVENVLPSLESNSEVSPTHDEHENTEAKRSVEFDSVTDPKGRTYSVRREIVTSKDKNGNIKRSVNETYDDINEPSPRQGAPLHVVGSSVYQEPDFHLSVCRAHNAYRRQHGAPDLILDSHLSHMAQEWAESLALEPYLSNSGSTYQGLRLGESIFSRWSNLTARVTSQEMVDQWYGEISKYDFDQEPTSIQGIGNFAQLVWSGSQRIGVGLATQPSEADNRLTNSKVVVVCFYFPPGNVTGQFKQNVKSK